MRRRNNWLAGLLALTILFSLAAPAAAVGGEITLSTAEDLAELARNCTLDSWSRGKRVVLAADIDLSGKEISPIPTFGGSFDGQGHTISGLSLTGSGNVRGLFRYLQPGGEIANLHVEGTITPTELQDHLGLLVGSNRGKLRACTAKGTVRGKSTIGGLVGVNESGGQIINCIFTGSVTGEHYVGGIAGQNFGSILQCVNQGSINTEEVEGQAELESMEDRPWNSTENLPACTDIGGITGFSTGILQSCQNTGPVGYEHMGYNVGGIAGRQSGYLNACQNQGTIQGRKDVGGIAGQLEPEIFLRYGEDTMNRLWTELGTLSDQMDYLLADADGIRASTTAQIKTMTAHAGDAQAATGDLIDAVTDWANGNLDQVNDLSARVSWALQQMTPILETLGDMPEELTRAVEALQEALDEAKQAGDLVGEAADDLQEALQDALTATEEISSAMEHIQASQDALKDALGDPQKIEAAMERLSDGVSQLGQGVRQFSEAMETLHQGFAALPDIGSAIGIFHQGLAELAAAGSSTADGLHNIRRALEQLKNNFSGSAEDLKTALEELKAAAGDFQSGSDALHLAGEHLLDAIDDLKDAGVFGDNAIEALRQAGEAMKDAFTLLDESTDALYEMIKTLAESPTIAFTPIGSEVTERGDALDGAVSNLLDSADDLNDLLSHSSEKVLEDLKGINRQLRVITDLLHQESSDKKNEDRDPIEDISDQTNGQEQRAGSLSESKNQGKILGDVNVAGIVGSMAIEYDFDPEDDLKETGDRSMDVHFQTKAVTRGCSNEGEVTGKKDDIGGIVGRMDLGQVTGCESYGTVTSTDGSYVGGIAGASWGTIRDSWVRCTLSGENYVGGVAGYGSTLSRCHTLVNLEGGSAYLGAVAGDVAPEGQVTGSTFTQTELGAIDGISYSGKAEPVAFGTLCAAGAPGTFAQMELRFQADGKEVAVVPFQYGKGIDSLPEIPPKAGYSASWPDMDYACLTASQTLEAIYTPYTSSLTDGGELPQILVDGSFSTKATVSHEDQEITLTDDWGKERAGTAYTVNVEDPMMKTITYTVHCRMPEEGGHYAILVQTDEGWTKQDSQQDGSYLLFPVNQETVTFCLVKDGSQMVKYFLAGLLLVSGFGFLLWRRKQRKKKSLDCAQESPNEGSSDE